MWPLLVQGWGERRYSLEYRTPCLHKHRGLLAHKELKELDFEVHSYERDHAPGGNWHYSDEVPLDAPVPNADPSIGDYEPSLPPNGVKIPYTEEYSDAKQNNLQRRAHRAPKPVWKTLKSNAPAVSSV